MIYAVKYRDGEVERVAKIDAQSEEFATLDLATYLGKDSLDVISIELDPAPQV